MKQEDIENNAIDYAIKVKPAYVDGYFERYQIEQAFIDGANWALKNQWTSVDDELPEDLEDVIVMSGNCGHGVDIGYYDKRFNAFFRTLSGDERIPATHWMLIPEFPIKWNKDGKQ